MHSTTQMLYDITDYEFFIKSDFDVPALSWVIPVQESCEFGLYPGFLCIKR